MKNLTKNQKIILEHIQTYPGHGVSEIYDATGLKNIFQSLQSLKSKGYIKSKGWNYYDINHVDTSDALAHAIGGAVIDCVAELTTQIITCAKGFEITLCVGDDESSNPTDYTFSRIWCGDLIRYDFTNFVERAETNGFKDEDLVEIQYGNQEESLFIREMKALSKEDFKRIRDAIQRCDGLPYPIEEVSPSADQLKNTFNPSDVIYPQEISFTVLKDGDSPHVHYVADIKDGFILRADASKFIELASLADHRCTSTVYIICGDTTHTMTLGQLGKYTREDLCGIVLSSSNFKDVVKASKPFTCFDEIPDGVVRFLSRVGFEVTRNESMVRIYRQSYRAPLIALECIAHVIEYLNLYGCHYESLDDLPCLPNLQALGLENTEITSCDTLPLKTPNITYLNLLHTDVSDSTPLRKLKSLDHLCSPRGYDIGGYIDNLEKSRSEVAAALSAEDISDFIQHL